MVKLNVLLFQMGTCHRNVRSHYYDLNWRKLQRDILSI